MHRAIDSARRAIDETDWSTIARSASAASSSSKRRWKPSAKSSAKSSSSRPAARRLLTHGPQLDAPLADALTYPAKLIDEYPWDNDLWRHVR
jgi:hypothetical protein